MGLFDVGQGADSRPDGHGVLEMMGTDGPGFSLCAVPLESSGQMNKWKSGGIPDQSLLEGTQRVRGGVKIINFGRGQGS